MSISKRIVLGIALPIVILVLWWLVTENSIIPPSLLPTLQSVKEAFVEMSQSGQLQNDLLISLTRVLQGFLMASVFGIFLGTIMGMSKTICAMVLPLITTFRQIPMIAWFPLIILWCGIGEMSKIVVIVIAAFFPVLVNKLCRGGCRRWRENDGTGKLGLNYLCPAYKAFFEHTQDRIMRLGKTIIDPKYRSLL